MADDGSRLVPFEPEPTLAPQTNGSHLKRRGRVLGGITFGFLLGSLLATSLAIVSLGALFMAHISPGSRWTALLAGFIVSGIGIGLANPTIAGAALRVVDPARTGMASGISNTARITGLAMGVAVLGALLQQRVGSHLAAAGYHGKELASAVSSSGLRATAGSPALTRVADAAFVSGLRLVLVVGFVTVLAGSVAAAALVRRRAEAPEPVLEPSS